MTWRHLSLRSASGAKYAHEEHDQGHHHNESDDPSANGRSTDIETATAKEEEENKYKQYEVHDRTISRHRKCPYGVLTPCGYSDGVRG